MEKRKPYFKCGHWISVLNSKWLNVVTFEIFLNEIQSLKILFKYVGNSNFKVTFVPMEKVRQVIQYKNYFEEFLLAQSKKIQDKIFKVIEIIETYQHVPKTYLAPIKTCKGLYEARIKLGSNIWRVFCFFDEGKLVILLNGFVKKDQKTPKKEIDKAVRLMKEYYEEKNKENGN